MDINIHEFNSPAHFHELGEGLRKIEHWIESGEGDTQYIRIQLLTGEYTLRFDRVSPTSAAATFARATFAMDSFPEPRVVFTAGITSP